MVARQFHWHEIRWRKNRNRNARAGKNSFPPTPFLFARPSVQFSAPPKAEQSVRILFKKGSSFVQQLRPFDSLSFAQGLRPNESKGSELAEGPTQKF